MSDARPRVEVQQRALTFEWSARCYEPDCRWTFGVDSPGGPVTYVQERARAHRAEHRKRASRG